MKKDLLYIPLAITGSVFGYYLGSMGGQSGWDLFWEIFCGTFLFYSLGFALLEGEKKYDMLVGGIVGLGVSLLVDWIAGSEIDVRNKLSFLLMGSFIGWGINVYWKQTVVGGLAGGVIGFAWGLLQSHLFGKVCLPPGLLNASLMFVQISIVGMGVGSLYMKFYGWQFIKPSSQI